MDCLPLTQGLGSATGYILGQFKMFHQMKALNMQVLRLITLYYNTTLSIYNFICRSTLLRFFEK